MRASQPVSVDGPGLAARVRPVGWSRSGRAERRRRVPLDCAAQSARGRARRLVQLPRVRISSTSFPLAGLTSSQSRNREVDHSESRRRKLMLDALAQSTSIICGQLERPTRSQPGIVADEQQRFRHQPATPCTRSSKVAGSRQVDSPFEPDRRTRTHRSSRRRRRAFRATRAAGLARHRSKRMSRSLSSRPIRRAAFQPRSFKGRSKSSSVRLDPSSTSHGVGLRASSLHQLCYRRP